jgi:GxxExxY protein
MTRGAQRRENAEEAEARRLRPLSRDELNCLTEGIIASAIEVHRHVGPGLLESAYEECLCYELAQRGLAFQRQVQIPVQYKGLKLDCSYRMDLLVEDSVIVEVKAVEQVLPVHSAQLLTYLKVTGRQIGLLINFEVPILKQGVKRIVNHFREAAGTADVSAASAVRPLPAVDSTSLQNPLRVSQRLSVFAGEDSPLTAEGRPH